MLEASVVDVGLAGVEDRSDATLGDLLEFVNAFNLRFGVASKPQQQQGYRLLDPKLVPLRDAVAPALAESAEHTTSATEAEDLFARMSSDELQNEAPKPPGAGGRPRR